MGLMVMKTSTISEFQSLPSCQRIMKTSTISESQSLPSCQRIMKTSTISEFQSLPSCQRIMKTSTISESQSLPSLTLYNHARMTTAAESSSLLPSDGDVNSCEDDPNCVEFAQLYSVGDVKSIVNLLV